jgi:FkbM family methyltransferase
MRFTFHKKLAKALKVEIIKYKKNPTSNSHIINLINHYNIDLILDVGANNGGFGKMLRIEGYTGEIQSFEPVTETYKQLKKITDKDSKWHIHKLALGETCSQQTINVTASSDLASFLSASEFGKNAYSEKLEVSHQENVTINTIDDFLAKEIKNAENRRVFLKMDTQGYDTHVIKGALKSINSIFCILSEISFIPLYNNMPHYLDSLKTYEELGFSVTGLYPISRKKDLSIIEMDCMLINKANAHD